MIRPKSFLDEADFKAGDKVVCILDQRFKGIIHDVDKSGTCYAYNVEWEGEVPRDSSGAMFFGWQLKKIEEEECWINIMPVIVWRVVPNISGHHYLKGHYKDKAICYFKLNKVDLYADMRNDYKIKKSRDGDCFTILKKDC